MEIIHIILGKANPDRLNGVNKVVFNMATEQKRAGKNVQVWGITPNPVHDYPARDFKTLLFLAEKFPFIINRKLKKVILQNKEAVFHLHGGWIPVFSSLAGFFFRHHIRYLITPHGAYNTVAMKRNSLAKKIYFQLFEKSLIRNAHKVHSIGKSEVDGLKSIFPDAHSFLLPYGFEWTGKPAKTTKSETFTIGFVGRLDTHTKGLDLLLSAFLQFRKKHTDSRLWIIGEGEGRVYLENFINENQVENVSLLGKKFGREKDELVSQMHVFAHPSRNEGLPTAVLEAAAMGIPSIVSEATNVADYVRLYNAGIAIADENIEELVQALETLWNAYEQDLHYPFQVGARIMLSNVFAWPALVEKYEELYK
jgi:glycosyltransferase involved in cell wall biosynthesis